MTTTQSATNVRCPKCSAGPEACAALLLRAADHCTSGIPISTLLQLPAMRDSPQVAYLSFLHALLAPVRQDESVLSCVVAVLDYHQAQDITAVQLCELLLYCMKPMYHECVAKMLR